MTTTSRRFGAELKIQVDAASDETLKRMAES
jgi:hypothetical protein